MRIPSLIGKPLCICALREQITPAMVARFVSYSAWHIPIEAFTRAARDTCYEMDSLIKATQHLSHRAELLGDELIGLSPVSEQEALYKKKPWLRLQDEHTRNKAKQRKTR